MDKIQPSKEAIQKLSEILKDQHIEDVVWGPNVEGSGNITSLFWNMDKQQWVDNGGNEYFLNFQGTGVVPPETLYSQVAYGTGGELKSTYPYIVFPANFLGGVKMLEPEYHNVLSGLGIQQECIGRRYCPKCDKTISGTCLCMTFECPDCNTKLIYPNGVKHDKHHC